MKKFRILWIYSNIGTYEENLTLSELPPVGRQINFGGDLFEVEKVVEYHQQKDDLKKDLVEVFCSPLKTFEAIEPLRTPYNS